MLAIHSGWLEMSVDPLAEHRPTERFEGQKPPWHFYAVFGAPLPALVLILHAAGVSPDDRLVVMATLTLGIALVSYVSSRFRNHVTLGADRLSISVWIAAPGGTVHVPYEMITRIEADDASGSFAIWFNDAAGDPDAKEIILRDPPSASRVKDAILQRRPSLDAERFDESLPNAAVVLLTARLPGLPGEKVSHKVETPTWVKLMPIGGLLGGGAIVLIADSDFSIEGVLVMGIVALLLALFFAAILKFQTYFILHYDRVDMREALGDRHRIKYTDVVDSEGHDSGWLSVNYTKKATLGFGGGETTAGSRLKPHSLAPVVAAAIRLGRDRAKHARGDPGA